jgi:hypothetical protein
MKPDEEEIGRETQVIVKRTGEKVCLWMYVLLCTSTATATATSCLASTRSCCCGLFCLQHCQVAMHNALFYPGILAEWMDALPLGLDCRGSAGQRSMAAPRRASKPLWLLVGYVCTIYGVVWWLTWRVAGTLGMD